MKKEADKKGGQWKEKGNKSGEGETNWKEFAAKVESKYERLY